MSLNEGINAGDLRISLKDGVVDPRYIEFRIAKLAMDASGFQASISCDLSMDDLERLARFFQKMYEVRAAVKP